MAVLGKAFDDDEDLEFSWQKREFGMQGLPLPRRIAQKGEQPIAGFLQAVRHAASVGRSEPAFGA